MEKLHLLFDSSLIQRSFIVIYNHWGIFKHMQISLFAYFICFYCCVCIVCLFFLFTPSNLCSLIVLRFNQSLLLGLVSFGMLSFHPPPPPCLWGLVFCSCHGSFHVSLAGRNQCLNTQEKNNKTNRQTTAREQMHTWRDIAQNRRKKKCCNTEKHTSHHRYLFRKENHGCKYPVHKLPMKEMWRLANSNLSF